MQHGHNQVDAALLAALAPAGPHTTNDPAPTYASPKATKRHDCALWATPAR